MFLREGERLQDAVGDVAELRGVAAVLAAGVRLGHVWDHSLGEEGRGDDRPHRIVVCNSEEINCM